MLLIHGARVVPVSCEGIRDPLGIAQWALHTQERRGHNIAAVAVANKLARIVWAVWHQQRPFGPQAPRA